MQHALLNLGTWYEISLKLLEHVEAKMVVCTLHFTLADLKQFT